MKLLIFLHLIFLLFEQSFAENISTKTEILKKSKNCLNDPQKQICKDLILEMEKTQILEFEQNRFKCQSSLLGLQTQLIEAYFFDKRSKNRDGKIFSYVIKNC